MSETKTKNSRSPIWHYFEPVDVKNTKCLLCESTYRNSGNTTNLIDHLKRKHREEYNHVSELIKNNQPIQNNNNNNDNNNDSEIPIAIENINTKQEPESTIEDVDEPLIDNSGDDRDQDFEAQDIQVVKIVPLPHARSEVWNYFGFVANDDGQIMDRSKVVCKICASTFCYSGNTTNFYSHLKSMHSEIHMRSAATSTPFKNKSVKRNYSTMVEEGEIDDNRSYQTINNSTLEEDALPDRSLESIIYTDDITQCIIDFLVIDCRPIEVVQGKGFQRLLRLLAPGYVLPDKHKLSLSLRKRLDEIRKERESSTIDRFNNLI